MSSVVRLATAICLLALLFCARPGAAQIDHLKCYKVKDSLKLGGSADLDTPQFGMDPGCKISSAALFCVPATKTNVEFCWARTAPPTCFK